MCNKIDRLLTAAARKNGRFTDVKAVSWDSFNKIIVYRLLIRKTVILHPVRHGTFA
jgi:hypothetical protein